MCNAMLSGLADELRKVAGIQEEDIEIAFALRQCIVTIDSAVFPNVSILIEINTREAQEIAGYKSPDKNPKEGYVIHVRDLSQKVGKLRRARGIFRDCGDGTVDLFPYEDSPVISIEDCLLAIGVHEVRHRFQRGLPILFSAEHEDDSGNLLNGIIRYVRLVLEETREIYKGEGESEEYIQRKTGPTEFDARVIERLVVNKFLNGDVSIKELMSLATLSPSALLGPAP